MRPSAKVLEAATSGRGYFGPITVGGSVQLWKMTADPSHFEINGHRSWSIQRMTNDNTMRGPEWRYTVPLTGRPMLYRTDTVMIGE